LYYVEPLLPEEESVVAMGPSIALKRRPDGSWIELDEPQQTLVRERWRGQPRDDSLWGGAGVSRWAVDHVGNAVVQCNRTFSRYCASAGDRL
jgi:hypothetical protein